MDGDLGDVLAGEGRGAAGRTSRARGRSAAPAASRDGRERRAARRKRRPAVPARARARIARSVGDPRAARRRAPSGPAASPAPRSCRGAIRCGAHRIDLAGSRRRLRPPIAESPALARFEPDRHALQKSARPRSRSRPPDPRRAPGERAAAPRASSGGRSCGRRVRLASSAERRARSSSASLRCARNPSASSRGCTGRPTRLDAMRPARTSSPSGPRRWLASRRLDVVADELEEHLVARTARRRISTRSPAAERSSVSVASDGRRNASSVDAARRRRARPARRGRQTRRPSRRARARRQLARARRRTSGGRGGRRLGLDLDLDDAPAPERLLVPHDRVAQLRRRSSRARARRRRPLPPPLLPSYLIVPTSAIARALPAAAALCVPPPARRRAARRPSRSG